MREICPIVSKERAKLNVAWPAAGLLRMTDNGGWVPPISHLSGDCVPGMMDRSQESFGITKSTWERVGAGFTELDSAMQPFAGKANTMLPELRFTSWTHAPYAYIAQLVSAGGPIEPWIGVRMLTLGM